LFASRNMLTYQAQNLYELWNKETLVMFDPAAVVAAIEEVARPPAWKPVFTFFDYHLEVDDRGMNLSTGGKENARVAMQMMEDEFRKWFIERLRSWGPEALPKPPGNRSSLVKQGGFPTRVHVCEDYDTDIEKRWWMCGQLETKDVPPGGR